MNLRFAKRNRVNIIFISLLIFSILMMSMDVKNRGKLSMLDEFLMDTASTIQRTITYSYKLTTDLWFGYIYLVGLREENLALKSETAELRNQINTLREAVEENKRLKGLLSFQEGLGDYRSVTARVIGISPISLFKTITINKGSVDGLKKGMAVATNDGVVGRILSSSANTSIVLLISDRNSDVDSLIQRNRDRGIAEGGDTDFIKLKYISKNADVALGDLVVTSGVGGVFQKGLIIGTVSKLDSSPGDMFKRVEVTPAVNFSKIEEVLVITHSPGETE